ncbi:MAG: carbohydrate ABC transporter permease [Clostridiales bacterium]|jgi:multiple sugar transport system permease protein|nr:carbohydrate ABC transporter permease [Clostridiales bacterium]
MGAQSVGTAGAGRPYALKAKKRGLKAFKITAAALWLVICIFPFYWSIVTSLKPLNEIMIFSLWPKSPTWLNFKDAFLNKDLVRAVFNTVGVTVAGMGVNIAVSLLAGYAFARIRFRGGKAMFKIMQASMMLPFAVMFIPTYIVLARFPLVGGNNILGQGGYGFVGQETQFLGIILPSCVSVYNIFFLRQFFLTLPNELGESAKIDGARELRIFALIYLPLMRPAVATLAIFTFQSGWNNYFWPYILGQGQYKVLTIVLRQYYTAIAPDHGVAMAFNLIITIPMILFFIVFQRYFMSGLTAGSVKE